ncbi:MAG: crossover junction endodeoxyribonuclease RuvC [Myxococcaceae bacterium]|jgi:crossover junction endodeoxyribonuclease RuvC|nr:crossover junction endodeoxyribonuclease RuvC [Myxococcaceae bacterium]
MRVLGVDPGSRFLGYGLVENARPRPRYLAHGVVRAGTTAPLAERLEAIFLELGRVIDVFSPDAIAVEGVFTHKNARSALILGHARGVVLLLAARARVPVFEYAPARVKRAIGAGGNDSKESVARMVTRLLALTVPLERADAYDALAIACCHAHQAGALASGRRGARAGVGGAAGFASRLQPNVVRPAAAVVAPGFAGDVEP